MIDVIRVMMLATGLTLITCGGVLILAVGVEALGKALHWWRGWP